MKAGLSSAILGVLFLILFWCSASAANLFVDSPFIYTVADEWSEELLKSVARFPRHEETALAYVSVALLPSAIALFAFALGRTHIDPLERAWKRLGGHPNRTGFALALTASLLASMIALSIVRGVPIIDDERAYLFQAELFASGRMKLPAAPLAFRNPMFLLEPYWMAKYTPGQSLLLLPGILVGLPNAIPVLLAGATVYFTYGFAKAAFDAKIGLLSALFMAASPFLWCISATLMPFIGTAACFSLCMWLVQHGLSVKRLGFIAGAGGAIGFCALIRPYDALLLGLPIFAYVLRSLRAQSFAFIIGGIPALLVMLAYNWGATGSPFSLPYLEAGDFRIGFLVQPLPGHDYVHTPFQALAQQCVVLGRLEAWFFGLPGALLLVVAGALAEKGRCVRMLLVASAMFFIGYTILPSTGTWDVGPTYYFVLTPALAIFAALGVRAVRSWCRPLPESLFSSCSWLPVVAIGVALVTTAPQHLVRLGLLTAAAEAPFRAVANSELGDSILVVPLGPRMAAAGYALGYPYRIENRTGTTHLVRPFTASELNDARRVLGAQLPTYRLSLDAEHFLKTQQRRFTFARIEP